MSGWGSATSSVFSNDHGHRRSLSTPAATTCTTVIQTSTPTSPTVAERFNDDEEYYEWCSSHPSSPVLSESTLSLMHLENGENISVDVSSVLAEGRHSMIFPLKTDGHPEYIVKCGRGDIESTLAVNHEIMVYERINLTSSAYLLQMIGSGYMELRGTMRPAIVLNRADYTLAEMIEKGMTGSDNLHIVHGIFRGLADLHAESIIHGDIKPHNIFLFTDKDMNVKIGDFGACQLTVDAHHTTKVGTLPYCAPELLTQEVATRPPTPSSDVYAAGVTVWQLLSKRPPFPGITSTVRILLAVKNGFLECGDNPVPLMKNGTLDESIWEAVRDCLAKDPTSRPTVAQVLNRVEAIMSKYFS